MFWFICIIIQLILWWVTFFKSKKMIREKIESRWNGTVWGGFSFSNERYKFPLGLVFIGLLLCLVPILGLFAVAFFTLGISNMRNSDFDDERPSFAIVELFKKKI